MIIRFNREQVFEFNENNFSSLQGYNGLYFIFLRELEIPYPFKNLRLIYIGMSESIINSIGKRLKDHITGRSNNKGIVGYHKRWGLHFTYLDQAFLKHIFTSEKVETIEAYFLENFANKFGTYPICNNKRGSAELIQKFNESPIIDWEFFGVSNG